MIHDFQIPEHDLKPPCDLGQCIAWGDDGQDTHGTCSGKCHSSAGFWHSPTGFTRGFNISV
ncbi:MAG TPA: hypothetical protein VH251_11315, partial [Verrucomicrobiae bacterium]|nr:hypothetical protein [Verrucomicrobiae bacterium]